MPDRRLRTAGFFVSFLALHDVDVADVPHEDWRDGGNYHPFVVTGTDLARRLTLHQFPSVHMTHQVAIVGNIRNGFSQPVQGKLDALSFEIGLFEPFCDVCRNDTGIPWSSKE